MIATAFGSGDNNRFLFTLRNNSGGCTKETHPDATDWVSFQVWSGRPAIGECVLWKVEGEDLANLLNKWHHFALTHNPANADGNAEWKFYWDGVLKGTKVCDGLTQGGKGWADYVQQVGSKRSGLFRIDSGCNGKAKQAFDEIKSAQVDGSDISISWPSLPSDYYYGLVATRKGATISLAFRASKRRDGLMSQPAYYTEVRFQGRVDK